MYLIELRSKNTYLNGYKPDFGEEKNIIYSCIIGMVLLTAVLLISAYKDLSGYHSKLKPEHQNN